MRRFSDRQDAGRRLAQHLSHYRGREDALVLALPRGGVPVAFEVVKELGLPLDVFVVRKLGTPGHEELAMGAIATGGVRVLNEAVVRNFNLSEATIDDAAERELRELKRREKAYRGERPAPDLSGRIVLLVDDGLATGATMRAAVQAVKAQGPREVVVAVPTAAPDTCAALRDEVDEIVCAETPEPFYGVGMWYEVFSQTTDAEVRSLLERAAVLRDGEPPPSSSREETA